MVGDFVADIIVEDTVIVELKSVTTLDRIHLAQCLNYQKATNLKICLMINFGHPRLEIKRVVLDL